MSADPEAAEREARLTKLRKEVAEQKEAARLKKEAEAKAAALQSFEMFDLNKDGAIDGSELKAGLEKQFGVNTTDAEIEKLLAEFDSNHTGTLEMEEWKVEGVRNSLRAIKRANDIAAREAARLDQEKSAFAKEKAALEEMLVGNSDDGPATRALACLPYILPLLDGAGYGQYLLGNSPVGAFLGPLVFAFRSLPFAGLAAFLIFGNLSRNLSLPKLLRFSFQHAIYIDIALFFPGLFAMLPLGPDLQAQLAEPGADAVFVALCAALAYSVLGTILTGKPPNKIPIIGETAERNIRSPFDKD